MLHIIDNKDLIAGARAENASNAVSGLRGGYLHNCEEIFTKEPKPTAGKRIVYSSMEMASYFEECRRECAWRLDVYENRALTRG